jgi:sugar phosphate permease
MAEARDRTQEPRARSGPIFFGWYIVTAGMIIQLWFALAWFYGMQIFFTPIVQTFGWSRVLVSGAFSLQRLEGSVISPIMGFLVDRIGPRRLMFPGIIIAGLGMIAMSYLQAVWMFYALVLLISVGFGTAMGIPRTWTVVQWFRRKRGRALGVMSSGAAAAGPMVFIVVWLIDSLEWRSAFVVLGLATWVVCLPLTLLFRAKPEQYGYRPDGDPPPADGPPGDAPTTGPSGSQGGAQESESMTVGQALRTPAFWMLTLVFAAQTMGVNGMAVHQIPYFESIGFTRNEAASVLAMFTALSVFGRLGGGLAMDLLNQRAVLAGLLACQALAFLILANITAYWHVVPFALLFGTAFGGMMPARGVLISTFFGTRNFGTLQGLTQSGTVVGGVIAPVLMGFVFDQTQSYVLSIYVLMAAAALAIPFTLFARPPRHPVQKA